MSDDFFLLPEALMLNLWLGLSIKSTVRFRCVSKPWCAYLSDPHFIYKNLTFSSDDANDHLLLFNRERPHYSLVSHETLIGTPFLVPPKVPHPTNVYVLTPPCDDIVCFNMNYRGSIAVCNLTTAETKVIPGPFDDGFEFSFITLGFGFDEKRKEYKIVQVLERSKVYAPYKMTRDDDDYEAYVYTLSSRSNGWRRVGLPNPPHGNNTSYRQGTFYWGFGNMIVSFDMFTEVFNTISIPFLDGQLSWIEVICKLKEGSMLMITINRDRKYRIWALLELGAIQSWTNLLVNDWRGKKGEPLGFWRNEVVIKSHSSDGLFVSDPFEREIKEIRIDESSDDIPKCLVWTHGEKPAPFFLRCLVWTKGKKSSSSSSVLSELQLQIEELE